MMRKVARKQGAVQFGGNANNGSNAGSFISNSNNSPSNSNANSGSQLSYENTKKSFREPCQHGKKRQEQNNGFGTPKKEEDVETIAEQ